MAKQNDNPQQQINSHMISHSVGSMMNVAEHKTRSGHTHAPTLCKMNNSKVVANKNCQSDVHFMSSSGNQMMSPNSSSCHSSSSTPTAGSTNQDTLCEV